MKEIAARRIASTQTRAGETPPKGPIGAVGRSGSTTSVIAARTIADRSSAQVSVRMKLCSASRLARIAVSATPPAAATRMSPKVAMAPRTKVASAAMTDVALKLRSASAWRSMKAVKA